MAKFIKHIGKHSDRRVAIVYRLVPGEEHMALVIYPDTLPTHFHDAVMKVIESDPGQEAKELADALFRSLLNDGRPILQTLHKEGMIKKVATNQIIVTPNNTSHVRLDELNKIFDGIEKNDETTQKMKDIDANLGFLDPAKKRAVTEDFPALDSSATMNPELSDDVIAKDLTTQANKLAAEAKGLIAESKRLKAEAKALVPAKAKKVVSKKKTGTKKKSSAKKSVA